MYGIIGILCVIVGLISYNFGRNSVPKPIFTVIQAQELCKVQSQTLSSDLLTAENTLAIEIALNNDHLNTNAQQRASRLVIAKNNNTREEWAKVCLNIEKLNAF